MESTRDEWDDVAKAANEWDGLSLVIATYVRNFRRSLIATQSTGA